MEAWADPGAARDLDDLARALVALRARAGEPSYAEIARRIAGAGETRPAARRAPGRITVYDCFRSGRKRIDVDLLVAIVGALGADRHDQARWRAAAHRVLGWQAAASNIRVLTCLPEPAAVFAGRREQLRRISEALTSSLPSGATDRAPRTGSASAATLGAERGEPGASASPVHRGPTVSSVVPLVLISGMPGVGKTQLALRAAHAFATASRGVCRQLYVNLRGHDPVEPPGQPAAVLAGLLAALGEPAERVHRLTEPARAARYRELLAAHDAVIVLDNAADAAQLAPLLPGPGRGVVLATSRRQIHVPPALRPALALVLQPLDEPAITELFELVLGADRVRAEPEAARRLGALCGGLPLDLALTATHAAHTPDWSLEDHAVRRAELPQDNRVRGALEGSYNRLPDPQRRMLRLLVLHPGQSIDIPAAATLANLPPDAAQPLLHALVLENLLIPIGARFTLHDLVREYAAAQLIAQEPHTRRQEAELRLADYYRELAAGAAATVPGFLRGEITAVPGRGFPDADAALRWFDEAWPDAVAVALRSIAADRPGHAVALSHALARYLRDAGRLDAALNLHEAVMIHGDQRDKAHTMLNLGSVHERLSRFDEALRLHRDALVLAKTVGDRRLVARITNQIGNVCKQTGRYAEALGHYRRAARAAARAGDPAAECRALANLSDTCRLLGRIEEAIAANAAASALARAHDDAGMTAHLHCGRAVLHTRAGELQDARRELDRAISGARAMRDRRTEVYALACRGDAALRAGDPRAALADNAAALDLAMTLGSKYWEATCHANLALVRLALGDPSGARDAGHTALAFALDMDDRCIRTLALIALGEIARAEGGSAEAREHYQAALRAARDLGDPYELGRAHEGLGDLRAADGEIEEAKACWSRAVEFYHAAGDVDELKAREKLARAIAPADPGRSVCVRAEVVERQPDHEYAQRDRDDRQTGR